MEVQRAVFLTVGYSEVHGAACNQNFSSGLDASEIDKLVGLPPLSFIAQLRKIQVLRREKSPFRRISSFVIIIFWQQLVRIC